MSKNGNVISKMLSESMQEFIKDNIKKLIGFLALAVTGILPTFIRSINNTKLEVRLSWLFILTSVLLILVLALVLVIRSNKRLHSINELLMNPDNDNVKLFNQGDIVIRKINMESFNPSKLTVVRTSNSEVVCRTSDNNTINYSPEELCTAYESQQIFLKEEIEIQRKEAENDRYMKEITSWNTWQ